MHVHSGLNYSVLTGLTATLFPRYRGLANHLIVLLYALLLGPLPLPYPRTSFTIDVLSALPRDIDHVRQLLFTLLVLFSLSQANHDLF